MRHRPLVGLFVGLALGFTPYALANPSDPFAGALPSRDTKPPEGVSVGSAATVSSQQGSASYSYPLDLPAGRNGMAPRLSLDYSSSAPLRGGVAVGWSLGGLPTIERDPGSDTRDTIAYRYGGQLLVLAPGDLGAGTRYRPVFDEGMTRLGLASGTWTVSTPDGVVRNFGNVSNASDGSTIWHLTSERDALGNLTVYTWVRSPYRNGAGYRLTAIEYSANPAAGLDAHARIELGYQEAAYCSTASGVPIGAQLDHHTGNAVVLDAQRLDKITVKVRDVPGGALRVARDYGLTYDATELLCSNDRPPLRYLDQIRVTAYDALGVATTAPPMTFGYGAKQRSLSHTFTPGTQAEPALKWLGEHGTDAGPESQLMDFDGDGINDQVSAAMPATGGTRCRLVVRRGRFGGSFDNIEQVIELPSAPWGRPPTELGAPVPAPAEADTCSLDGQVAAWGGGHDNAPTAHCWFDKVQANYRFLDWDHDGDLDLVTWIYKSGFAHAGRDFPSSSAFFADNDTTPPPTCGTAGATAACECEGGQTADGAGGCRRECGAGGTYDPSGGSCTQGCTSYETCQQWPAPEPGDPGLEPHCTMEEPVPEDQQTIRVYYNRDGEFADFTGAMTPAVKIANPPVPLPSTGNVLEAPVNATFALSPLVDIDGDGRLDMITLPPAQGNPGGATTFRVWRGTADGKFELDPDDSNQLTYEEWPKGNWAQDVGETSAAGSVPVISETAITWLDIDGDGLLDILTSAKVGSDTSYGLAVSYNQGGSFSAPRRLNAPGNVGQSRIDLQGNWSGAPALQPGWRADTRQMVDVDQDGLAELVSFTVSPGGVSQTSTERVIGRINGDAFIGWKLRGTTWEPLERLIRANNQRAWSRRSDFIDLTGDGLPDLVELGDDGRMTVRTDVPGSAPIRLLATIDNGRGAVTRYTYARSTDPSVVTVPAGSRNDARWVVRTVSTTPGALQPEIRTSYRYEEPMFGTESPLVDRTPEFLGYSTITIDRSGQLGDASSRTVDVFAYGVSPNDWRGHLVAEWSYAATAGGWQPIQVASSIWVNRALVGGQASFTFRDSLITRTCDAGATEAQCAIEPENRRTQRETWTVWTASGTQPILYANTQSTDERPLNNGWGGFERRVVTRDFQERVGQSPYAATDYRLLLTEEETRADGSSVALARTSTTYDPRGLPTDSNVFTGSATWQHTQRTFDAAGNVLTIKRPNQFANGSNAVRSIAYDGFGLYPVRTTNELGHIVFDTHEIATGALVRREGPNKRTLTGSCFICVVYAPEAWTVDGFGRVLQHRVATDGSNNGYLLTPIEWFSYTDGVATSRRTDRLRDLGGTVKLSTIDEMDGLGRIVRRTEVGTAGAYTTYDYDAGGALRLITVPSPVSDGERALTTYDRDGAGRVVRFTSPDGGWQTVTYRGLEVESESFSSDGNGPATRVEHDPFGRLVAVHEPDETGDHVTRYGYDAAGRMTSIVDADGVTTTMEYDWAGQRKSVVRGTRTWSYGYDSNGNLTSQGSPVPAGGLATAYTSTTTYDALDRSKVHTPAVRTLSPTLRSQLGIGPTTTTYDTASNGIGAPVRVTMPFGTIDYTYDVRGRIKREQRAISTTASGASVSATHFVDRTYNALGAPIDVLWDDATLWRTTYDSRGLVSNVSWADPVLGYKSVAVYTRGAAGQPRTRSNAYGQRRDWSYDVLGRVTYDRVWSPATPNSSFAERSYGYDGFGRLGAVTGTIAGVSAEADFDYDGRGRLAHAYGPGPYTAAMTYSPAGNITRATVSATLEAPARDVTYQYGAVDPQAVDRLVNPGGSTFAQLGYDLAGNLTQRTIGASSWTITPDGDDLVRQVTGPQGIEIYYFGPGGERMAAIGPDGVKLWFAESETHYTAAGSQTVRWHHLAAGETLARVENHTAIELQYEDALHNLMVTTSPAGTLTSSFLYGGFGEVVASTGNTEHRRQFNGKEADRTSGLRHYGFRSYDPVLLRWTAADPMYRFAPDAAWTEPQRANLYAFSLNNPLTFYDPDGRDVADDAGQAIEEFGEGFVDAVVEDATDPMTYVDAACAANQCPHQVLAFAVKFFTDPFGAQYDVTKDMLLNLPGVEKVLAVSDVAKKILDGDYYEAGRATPAAIKAVVSDKLDPEATTKGKSGRTSSRAARAKAREAARAKAAQIKKLVLRAIKAAEPLIRELTRPDDKTWPR